MVCPPLCGGVCRGHVQYPAFAPDAVFLFLFFCFGSSEVAVGFFVCIFWSRIRPNSARLRLFSSLELLRIL